jgi:Tol biopolymer transport system component
LGWGVVALFAISGVMDLARSQPPTTTRVSVGSAGQESNNYSNVINISGDGRYVVFHSVATNLVAADTNDTDDIFLHDFLTGKTIRVSVNSEGVQGNDRSLRSSVSSQGRFVSFDSQATNLVASDSNNSLDVFIHEVLTGETTRISVDSGGEEGNAGSWNSSMSADGRYVRFTSDASNLAENDHNGVADVFVHDRLTGEIGRVNVGPGGTEANGYSSGSGMSADGRIVSFLSDATNLVGEDSNGVRDAFVHDRLTAETRRVSVNSQGEEGNQSSQRARISGDGRFIVFDSESTNLVEGDSNGFMDVFLHNRLTGETRRVSVGSEGTEANGLSRNAVVSYYGRFVSYFSEASNLVPNDTNESPDAFRYDRLTGETIRVSLSNEGSEAEEGAAYSHISYDGSRIIFQSGSANLVTGDTNETTDIFLREIPLNELYFAQFGEGMDQLFSQILLFNLNDEAQVTAQVNFRDESGNPLTVDLNGNEVNGELEGLVDPSGMLALQTDGSGDLVVGSLTVQSDWPLSGIVVFGGSIGLAGVGHSPPLPQGFLAPIETRGSGGGYQVNTGLAVMNLEAEAVTLNLTLRDQSGHAIDTAQLVIDPRGHIAKFVTELDWPTDVVFDNFRGTLHVESLGRIASTVLQTRPGQLATLPVIALE